MVLFILKVVSYILAIISASFAVPIICGLCFGEEAVSAFVLPLAACLALALVLFLIGRKRPLPKLSVRGSYILVAFSWLCISLLGAVPYVLSGAIPRFADAFFESVSGFSTTGATVLAQVENLPRCIRLWRCQTHWLGGMGIIVLTVALLPLLGVGGFQLIKAETTGPEKGKMTPKIAVTAKILWFIYLGMTLLQALLLLLAGVPFWEALAHAFSTLSSGGFSTRDASIASFASGAVDWICIAFMVLSGVNFSLYYQLLTGKLREIAKNSELKAYLSIILLCTLAVAASIAPMCKSGAEALRHSLFQVSSVISTTGFGTADFTLWPPAAQFAILLLMFVGGCSGSTAGGFKVVRWVILAKQAGNEIKTILHPHGVFTIRLNGRAGRKDVVYGVAAFTFLYFALVFATAFVAACNGADLFSSFTAALSMLGNIGPGFGMVGPSENFGFFSDATKYWFSFVMIAGRLELYTAVIFFFPGFWKK